MNQLDGRDADPPFGSVKKAGAAYLTFFCTLSPFHRGQSSRDFEWQRLNGGVVREGEKR